MSIRSNYMENFIIIAIIAIVFVTGIVYTIKHFKGQSGCCGGGSYKPKRKKLSDVLYKKTFYVDGMVCDHCKARVEEVVNDIKGIAGKVNLKKNELTIAYAEEIDDSLIVSRLKKSGYTAKVK